jgi:hypothetical protein
MVRKEVTLQSPLRILDRSIRGGLGKGNLGVVMAPAGVGKSACLVQIGLDALMRERGVLHVAAGQTVEHVSASYDALFEDLAELVDLSDRAGVRQSMGRRRLIQAFAGGAFGPQGLEDALASFQEHLGLTPSAILVDGFDWSGPGCAAALAAIKASARRVGAELWMTAQTPRQSVAPPCERCAALVDVGVFLEPQGSLVKLRLVRDFGDTPPVDVHLSLHSETMRLVKEDAPSAPVPVPAAAFTLLASGSAGAEAAFGECAERWGLEEVNFTFEGRGPTARGRGLVELSEDELRMGDVSAAYLRAHMHRSYPDTQHFKRVLQAIWHQVSTAGEVFSVGTILPDKTAHGGTGWAVELARHWGKPVHVFDQERDHWFVWDGREWIEEPPPSITHVRFAGAGTRSLSETGKAAIHALFERSFGER